jgi:hypothetical protein
MVNRTKFSVMEEILIALPEFDLQASQKAFKVCF